MMNVIAGLLADYGLLAGGGVTIAWAGLWLRRAVKVADYIKLAGMIMLLTGAGALAGVVDIGRLVELASIGFDVVSSLR